MEDFQPIVINEEQEEKFIKESIKKEYSIDVPARLIRMVIDAQLEYMESIGLIDKGE
jgi:exonuclease V gamma subunit